MEGSAIIKLYDHVNNPSMIKDSQLGFRVLISTETAQQYFIHHGLNTLDTNQFTVSVIIDLSKAFDTINYYNLFKKSTHYC